MHSIANMATHSIANRVWGSGFSIADRADANAPTGQPSSLSLVLFCLCTAHQYQHCDMQCNIDPQSNGCCM